MVRVLLPLFLAACAVPARAARIHHDMDVTLLPGTQELVIVDTVTFTNPEGFSGILTVLLHGGLALDTAPLAGLIAGIDPALGPGHPDFLSARPLQEIRLKHDGAWPWQTKFVFKARGKIHHPLTAAVENYAQSFQETPGTISVEGVTLSGETFFYPHFPQPTAEFRMAVRLPGAWDAVSEGRRVEHQRGPFDTFTVWESTDPMDDIHLIAAPFTEYGEQEDDPAVFAFLRQPDPALAQKYLTITETYLNMYQGLLGKYPHPKFALVENFWETGYGMTSFTLLGPKIIRLPFILHTSYPHEILHNWWGNGVFVDYRNGNWAEGLTAYLADHLLQEVAGKGAEYRRDALEKYRNFAAGGKDFPLAEFTSRRSSASQAVGYGKSLMFFHMLRQKLGDAAFREGLRAFYKEFLFKRASFADLGASFEKSSGKELKDFVNQWVGRAGAPDLRLAGARVRVKGTHAELTLTITQEQPGPAFRLDLPAALLVEAHGEKLTIMRSIALDKKRQTVQLSVPGRPLAVKLDPEFDVFRLLDRLEAPPTVSQALGAAKTVIVTPAAEPDLRLRLAYEKLAEDWRQRAPGQVLVISDANHPHLLPNDRAVWILGRRNLYADQVKPFLEQAGLGFREEHAVLPGREIPLQDHSFVFVARAPGGSDLAAGWVFADGPEAVPGLARKFPHYGKYGYLAFEGTNPAIIEKGAWASRNEKLLKIFPGGPGKFSFPERAPLAKPGPAFSAERMRADVSFLSSEEINGRGLGTPELDLAATYIAAKFRLASLEHLSEELRYSQTFSATADSASPPLTNIIGVYPGSNPAYNGQSVVVSAHYDHLGPGHPGADNNASGVAVLLELARALKKNPPERSVLFAAFTAGKSGNRGSRYFVSHSTRFPVPGIVGMVELNAVGRLRGGKLAVHGTASSDNWTPAALGAAHAAGVDIHPRPKAPGSGDSISFLEREIPALRLSTEKHADTNGPGDTLDKIDYAGMEKIAAFTKEIVDYLASTPTPPKFAPGAWSGPADPDERRLSFGAVPDFSHHGPGVRIREIRTGSSAEAAGLRPGDIMTGLGDSPLNAIADLSRLLRRWAPGDTIQVAYTRDGTAASTSVTVIEH